MVDGQHSEMLFLEKIYYEKYTKKSYSLTSVDLVIDYLFKNINKGVYIDVGCNHPIKFNNTYLLYKRGWSGINIDSDHDSIKLFNKFRINDFNVRNIVSDDENVKKLYFYHKRSALNTLSKELVDSRTSKPSKIIEEKNIEPETEFQIEAEIEIITIEQKEKKYIVETQRKTTEINFLGNSLNEIKKIIKENNVMLKKLNKVLLSFLFLIIS